MRENPSEFWKAAEAHRDSIVARLKESGHGHLAVKVEKCQTEKSFITCLGCSTSRVAFNHCDSKWCPLCVPRLAAARRESIEVWTQRVRQPKHVVLTARNSETLSRRRVRRFVAAFNRLRRSKFGRGWRGGILSLEVTNEGRGWHLHAHALIDADWIDAGTLAQEWAKRIGQDFAIVKVKDVREKSYLAEVTKYAVKGSEMAAWSGDEIAEFITAFRGARTFFVFGACFKIRAEVAKFLKEIPHQRQCECGCKVWRFMDAVGTAEDHVRRGMPSPRQRLIRAK